MFFFLKYDDNEDFNYKHKGEKCFNNFLLPKTGNVKILF